MPQKNEILEDFLLSNSTFWCISYKRNDIHSREVNKTGKRNGDWRNRKSMKKVTQIMDHIGRLIYTGLEMIDHF